MDDETLLSRFLDGELDETETADFEARLEREPALAERLERWLAEDRAVAGDLAAMLAGAPAIQLPGQDPIDLAAHRAAKMRQSQVPAGSRRWFAPASIAASLALAGLLSLTLLRGGEGSPLGALETLPAGQTTAMAGGGQLTAVLTFAAADGRWCREYAVSGQGSGIACRDAGEWQAQGDLARSAGGPENSAGGYATAAGADPAALDGIYESLGASDPLGSEEEADLLQSGWTKRPG